VGTKTARPGLLLRSLAAAAVLVSLGGCGAMVPACDSHFTSEIYLLGEPSTSDRATVRIDPERARQAAVDHFAASGGGHGIAPVGICLGVTPDPDPATGAARVVYAVRFEYAAAVEITIVDATDGLVLSSGAVVP
jgi:hypothetical protein